MTYGYAFEPVVIHEILLADKQSHYDTSFEFSVKVAFEVICTLQTSALCFHV